MTMIRITTMRSELLFVAQDTTMARCIDAAAAASKSEASVECMSGMPCSAGLHGDPRVSA
jgi:hypothetical protein